MLSTRTFVLGIVAIMVLVTGAYMIIAPRAAEKADMGSVPSADERAESTSLPTAVSSEEGSDRSLDDVPSVTKNEGVRVDSDAVAPTPVPTTAPVTPPVTATTPVTPKEDPVPTPIPAPDTYTLADVALHANATSCWSVIRNTVYDLTSFVEKHPGGERNILKICGKDGTSLFEGKHGGDDKPEAALAKFVLGKVQ